MARSENEGRDAEGTSGKQDKLQAFVPLSDFVALCAIFACRATLFRVLGICVIESRDVSLKIATGNEQLTFLKIVGGHC